MARTDFTSLQETARKFMASMEGALADLLNTANEQRKELVSLYQQMADIRADIPEFAGVAAEVANTFDDISDIAEDVAMKIGNAIEGGVDFTPDCDYEELVGFCDECGRAIARGEDYTKKAEDYLVCADCCLVEDKGYEFEDENGEQDTFEELADSVRTNNQ